MLGSYCIVLMVDMWTQGSFKWSLINSIHKASLPSFWNTDDSVPYHLSDFILLAVWAVICGSGVLVQFLRERGREHFPPHPWLKLKREETELRHTVHQAIDRPARQIQDEQRHLLEENSQQNYNTLQQD